MYSCRLGAVSLFLEKCLWAQNNLACVRDCECVRCELLDASSYLRATRGSRSRRTRVTLGDARTLTYFAFFPTNFWGEKVTARSLYSLCICGACFYSFCCARLLSYKLLVPHHRDSSNHFSCRIKIKEVHFISWVWKKEMVGYYSKLQGSKIGHSLLYRNLLDRPDYVMLWLQISHKDCLRWRLSPPRLVF